MKKTSASLNRFWVLRRRTGASLTSGSDNGSVVIAADPFAVACRPDDRRGGPRRKMITARFVVDGQPASNWHRGKM